MEDKLPEQSADAVADEMVDPSPVQPAYQAMDQNAASDGSIIDGNSAPVSLLVNGSCEEPVPADGSLPGWHSESGAWAPRRNGPDAADGHAYFFAGRSSYAELTQGIYLAEFGMLIDQQKLRFMLDGLVRSYKRQSPDTAELAVTFFAADETQELGHYSSGQVANADNWEAVLVSGVVPQGARRARVFLISRRGGEDYNNDGYFDKLRFLVDVAKDGHADTQSSKQEGVEAAAKTSADPNPEITTHRTITRKEQLSCADEFGLPVEKEIIPRVA